MTPLRILHTIASDRFAGVEQFVRRLAAAQAEHGHHVTVAGGAPGHMSSTLERAGVHAVPARTALDVMRAVRRTPADVVNSHMTAADAASAIALLGRRTALVSTRHFAGRRAHAGPLSIDPFLRRVDAEIAVSRAVAAATGMASTVVHPGLPAATNTSDDQPRHPVARRILMVQRLQPEKHTAIGVRAFATSGLAAEDWGLLILGEGPDRAELEALIAELGLRDSALLIGFRDDVPELLKSSSLLLSTCPVEGLGLAVLEAMSFGLAPIAAGAAGHLDLLEGLDERALFRPDDVADAATALRAFADDPDRRRRLAAAARERALSEFSIERQVAGTDAVYRDAIAGRLA
ncbi:glycosyltransferase [Microbacterium murale]|uniref:Glycosyltransferase involved in cell wall biosynthesis n=1 Tax=Microbacterium murale TaxID=1081040 RepID=A0ABU0PBA5_9MICO|nr:glycosyltransferase [Microbacterium murale]MDQ0644608.1 glycosyltransferase involved in cell wall biosynthesis [Microbacterium murale]